MYGYLYGYMGLVLFPNTASTIGQILLLLETSVR